MIFNDIVKTGTYIIISLGGGGAIILAFSSWLGKLWAEKMMAKERAGYEQDLAELRARLEQVNAETLSKLRTELEIHRDTFLKTHNDKIEIYRFVSVVISEFLADLNMLQRGAQPIGDVMDRFNRGRLKAHGNLAMLAPQSVMDAYDTLVDNIFFVLENLPPDKQQIWNQIRRDSYVLINVIRKDIGIDKNEIEYNGKR